MAKQKDTPTLDSTKRLFSTREVAQFLGINEKMVYALISEKGLPATKVTGKWLFPRHLVEQWIEANTINFPEPAPGLPPYQGLLIIAGSNDPLLDRALSLFNRLHPEHLAVFGNLGSMGGLRALRRDICHIASSHLLQEDGQEYNFDYADSELENRPAVVNFCRREQGILLQPGNPRQIQSVGDLVRSGVRIVNRPLGTGTRLLFDRELKREEISGEAIPGYNVEMSRHIDVGLEILSGRAEAAPGIRPVAGLLGLDFLPLRWERYDLLIRKERFFDQGVQCFVGMLHEEDFREMAVGIDGYDVSISGKMLYPAE